MERTRKVRYNNHKQEIKISMFGVRYSWLENKHRVKTSKKQTSDTEKEINNYLDGCLYLMIKQSDLDNLDFSNTVTIYQAT
jgi:hypothetical protein